MPGSRPKKPRGANAEKRSGFDPALAGPAAGLFPAPGF